jgi:hypothetical protein
MGERSAMSPEPDVNPRCLYPQGVPRRLTALCVRAEACSFAGASSFDCLAVVPYAGVRFGPFGAVCNSARSRLRRTARPHSRTV